MEILGLSHPAVSTAAATMQKLIEQARSSPESETRLPASGGARGEPKQLVLDLSPDQSIRPTDASSESVLDARTPVEMPLRPGEPRVGGEAPPESETYQFPEELPMNFLEMIDMLRADTSSPSATVSGGGLSITDPASAAEAQRLNKTA